MDIMKLIFNHQKRVGDIVNSFLTENYQLVLKSSSLPFIYVKLKHRRNGNEITIKATQQEINVYKNQKLIKNETCNNDRLAGSLFV